MQWVPCLEADASLSSNTKKFPASSKLRMYKYEKRHSRPLFDDDSLVYLVVT